MIRTLEDVTRAIRKTTQVNPPTTTLTKTNTRINMCLLEEMY